MAEVEQTPATAEYVAPESEAVQVGTDTTEPVAETDEQKNERELAERKERSERAQRGVAKRIGELTAEKHYERQRAERAEQERAQLLAMVQGRPQGQPQGNGPPAREQFADYESYIDARTEWRAEQRLQAWQGQQREQAEKAIAQMQRQQATTAVQGHIEEFAKATPDWDRYVASAHDVQLPDGFDGVLTELGADSGPLLLAIGKNPALAQQFHGRSYQQQLVMAAKIVAAAPAPQVSKAPPPGQPVGSRGGSLSNEPSDKDSADEWLRKRRAQLKARG